MFYQHLTDRKLLKISGDDAENFLENIVTCRISGIAEGNAGFGALLTPQGKILFDFFIVRLTDGFMLDVHEMLFEDLSKRLLFYRLRARVTIEPADSQTGVYARWGGEAPVDGAPGVVDPRHDAMGWRVYDNTAPDGEKSDYNIHRIGIGMPEGGVDFEYGNVWPHDALMDQFGGVDFQKGCFIGQEVVSRMHHRGTARKRVVMVRAKINLPEYGSPLTAGGMNAGRLGSVAGKQGLALLRLDRIAAARAENAEILADKTDIEVSIQDWVDFDWPEAD